MGKSRKKQQLRKRDLNSKVSVTHKGFQVKDLSPEQQAEVSKLRRNLELELDEIERGKPVLPPPPEVHEYVQETHRESEDPMEQWIKVTCKNCAFLLFVQYKCLHEKMQTMSHLCAAPFAKRSEAEKILQNWQDAVSRAYAELQGRDDKPKELTSPNHGPQCGSCDYPDPHVHTEYVDTYTNNFGEKVPIRVKGIDEIDVTLATDNGLAVVDPCCADSSFLAFGAAHLDPEQE